MKEKYSEQLYCKKVSFSYNRDTTTNNKTTIYEKKPHGSFYVAYVQESPETANPPISSLRVSRPSTVKKKISSFPAHPSTVNFNLHPSICWWKLQLLIYFTKKSPKSSGVKDLHTRAILCPSFFLANGDPSRTQRTRLLMIQPRDSIDTGQFSATRKTVEKQLASTWAC